MPNYYTMDPGLTDEQVDELVTYLQSLKPADGCPDEGLLVGGQVPAGGRGDRSSSGFRRGSAVAH